MSDDARASRRAHSASAPHAFRRSFAEARRALEGGVRSTLSRVVRPGLASASASQATKTAERSSRSVRRPRRVADVAFGRGNGDENGSTNGQKAGESNQGGSDANKRGGDLGKEVTADSNDKPLLICAFDIAGATPEQEAMIREVMTMKPNYSYRAGDVAQETERIKQIGIFRSVRALGKDTRDGLRMTFEVVPFEHMRGVEMYGLESVPVKAIEESFRPMMGKPLNYTHVLDTLRRFKGYTVATKNLDCIENIHLAEDVSDGVLRLGFTDVVVDDVKVEIEPSINQKTGKENKVLSKPESVLAYFQHIQRGKSINGWRVAETLRSFMAENPRFAEPQLNVVSRPGKQASRRTLLLQLKEKACKGITGGGGMSARGLSEGIFSGFAGYLTVYHNNLFGKGQMLNAGVEATPKKGGRGITVVRPQVNVRYHDPWVGFGPTRTSRTISIESASNNMKATHGVSSNPDETGAPDITAPGLSEISVQRFSHTLEHSRPLLNGWNGTVSVGFNRNSVLDNDGNLTLFDAYGAPVTFSGTKHDTSLTTQLRFTYGGPNAAQLVLSAEQALPVQPQWLNYTRTFAKARRSFNLFNSSVLPGPMQLVLSSKGGNVIGDLPPYDAFSIGGTASVRGYNDGAIGAGRKFVVGSAEARLPFTTALTGCLFFDYGSDLHSGSNVLGDPAGTRGKPGSGFSYGVAGIFESGRIPFRFDYARNDQGSGRFHFSLSRDFN